MLSYKDCPEIRELYKDTNIMKLTRLNNLKERYEADSEFKELLIMSYEEEMSQMQLIMKS